MATVINRETKTILFSVHTPAFLEVDWIINPRGLGDILGVPAHYRVIEGDTVREATPEEKEAIDAQRLPIIKAQRIAAFADGLRDELVAAAYDTAAALAGTVNVAGAEFQRVVALAQAAKSAQELFAITSTFDSEGPV